VTFVNLTALSSGQTFDRHGTGFWVSADVMAKKYISVSTENWSPGFQQHTACRRSLRDFL